MLADARVGTSGFAFRDWEGTVYPAGLQHADMLAVYSRRLSAVELSAPPGHAVAPLVQWAGAVPPGFQFSLKLPHQIGRDLRMPRAALRGLEAFLDSAEELGDHLGPLLIQVPATLQEDRLVLREFLAGAPRSVRLAFEFRHPSWQTEGTRRLLSGHDAALVLSDTGAGPPPLELTADFAYVRIRREDAKGAPWEEWAERLAALVRRGIDVYVFLKHDRRGLAVERAQRLEALLRTRGQPGNEQTLLA